MFGLSQFTVLQDDKLRVFLCGAHSTGKSTLLSDLRPMLRMIPVSEVARKLIQVTDTLIIIAGCLNKFFYHQRWIFNDLLVNE